MELCGVGVLGTFLAVMGTMMGQIAMITGLISIVLGTLFGHLYGFLSTHCTCLSASTVKGAEDGVFAAASAFLSDVLFGHAEAAIVENVVWVESRCSKCGLGSNSV